MHISDYLLNIQVQCETKINCNSLDELCSLPIYKVFTIILTHNSIENAIKIVNTSSFHKEIQEVCWFYSKDKKKFKECKTYDRNTTASEVIKDIIKIITTKFKNLNCLNNFI